jgi:hypothetical protein
MSNLPGFEFAQHVINTLSGAWLAQTVIWNNAWGNIESGKYEFKNLLGDWARSYRLHYQACREISTFEVRSVPWQHVSLRDGEVKTVSFEAPSGLTFPKTNMSTPEHLGARAQGTVLAKIADVKDGLVTVQVEAKDGVAPNQQWIAFVYEDAIFGPPLGVVLVLIGP